MTRQLPVSVLIGKHGRNEREGERVASLRSRIWPIRSRASLAPAPVPRDFVEISRDER